jgi:hypothetical protein
MAKATGPSRKGIKDIFYETRALMGRDFTVRRFAGEVLGGAVHPLMLGYIEKGTRFPNESLVRRLAAIRNEDPQELLAVLWRDRMIHAFGKELRRVLGAPQGLGEIEDADLAVVVSHAIAGLPEGGEWTTLVRWRRKFRLIPRRGGKADKVSEELAKKVEEALLERDIIEVESDKVRRKGYHFVAKSTEERGALALEYCDLFAKGLLDKLALQHVETGTYLRNHYLNIDEERLPEFQRRLDEAVTKLADEFLTDKSPRTKFLNVLITSTPF